MAEATRTYKAVIKQHGGWWIGWIEEVPGVNCQERSRAELLAALKETLLEALAFNRADARRFRAIVRSTSCWHARSAAILASVNLADTRDVACRLDEQATARGEQNPDDEAIAVCSPLLQEEIAPGHG